MKCKAIRSTNGEPCANWAMRGQEVCRAHGGRARQAKAAAKRRLAEKEARRAVETYGLPVDIDPAEALLEEVRWTAGHVRWLRSMVQSLSPDELRWGKSEEVEKGSGEFPGTDTTEKAAPNVWVQLYQAERRHLVDVCATAIKVGIEERRVRLAESQGALIAEVIRGMLDDPELGLTQPQKEVGRAVASRHLRVIASAS